jgi:hypothetical protein
MSRSFSECKNLRDMWRAMDGETRVLYIRAMLAMSAIIFVGVASWRINSLLAVSLALGVICLLAVLSSVWLYRAQKMLLRQLWPELKKEIIESLSKL